MYQQDNHYTWVESSRVRIISGSKKSQVVQEVQEVQIAQVLAALGWFVQVKVLRLRVSQYTLISRSFITHIMEILSKRSNYHTDSSSK